MSSGSTLSRAALRVVPLIRGPPHPTSYLCHRRMGVQQGHDHLIEARSHRRGIIDRGIISARGRTNETVTNSGGLKISSELIDVKLPPRSSALSFVDGRFNLGGMKGPGHSRLSDAPLGALMSTAVGLSSTLVITPR